MSPPRKQFVPMWRSATFTWRTKRENSWAGIPTSQASDPSEGAAPEEWGSDQQLDAVSSPYFASDSADLRGNLQMLTRMEKMAA